MPRDKEWGSVLYELTAKKGNDQLMRKVFILSDLKMPLLYILSASALKC